MTQIDTHGDNMGQHHLYSLLFYLNFNDTSFLQYLISGIKEEIDSTIIPIKKIKILKKMNNTMGKLLVRNDVVLDPGNPPINVMFLHWLKGQLEELQS